MKNLIRTGLSLLAAASICMAGCSLPNSSQNTSLQVDDAGAVTETIVETKDGEYTVEDLESYIKSSIDAYDAGDNASVSLDSCKIEGDTVKIVMKYKTVQDYSNFNSVTCFLGTLAEAEAAGYDIDQNWMARDGSEATEDDLGQISDRKKEWKVFIVSEPVYVRVPDKILYTTSNVTVTGRLTANVETVMSADIENPDAATQDTGSEVVSASSTAGSSVSSSSVSSSSADSAGDDSGSTAMYSVTAVSEDSSVSTSSSTSESTSASTSGESVEAVSSSSETGNTVSTENEKYVTVSNEYAYIIYK